jgi:hypothetical protein
MLWSVLLLMLIPIPPASFLLPLQVTFVAGYERGLDRPVRDLVLLRAYEFARF